MTLNLLKPTMFALSADTAPQCSVRVLTIFTVLTQVLRVTLIKASVVALFIVLSFTSSLAMAQDTGSSNQKVVLVEEPVKSFKKSRLGLEFGFGVGASRPFIQKPAGEFGSAVNNRATNLHIRAGGVFRVSPLLHLTATTDWSIGKDIRPFGHDSGVLLLGVGGVLGDLDRPGSFYLSGTVGRGYINVSDEEIETIGATFRTGAKGEGPGYRISIGRTITSDARWEFSYLRINGDAPEDNSSGRVDFHAGTLNLVLTASDFNWM